MPNLFFPRTVRPTVEQDKMPFVDGASTFVHIADGLFQSLLNGFFDIAS
jgi:hypothetical protein